MEISLLNNLLVLNSWQVRYDAQLNRAIYKQLETAAPEDRGCLGCKEFIECRDVIYPVEFRELLVTVGIDYCKEAEVVTYTEPGIPPLSGWYNFVDEIEKGENELYYVRRDFRIQVRKGFRTSGSNSINQWPVHSPHLGVGSHHGHHQILSGSKNQFQHS